MRTTRHILGIVLGLFLWGAGQLGQRAVAEDLMISVTIMIPIPVNVVITFQPLGHSLAGNLLLPVITTDPPGLPYTTTYTDLDRGGPPTMIRPTLPGRYLVTVTVIAPGYEGSSSEIVVIPGPVPAPSSTAAENSNSGGKCGLGGAFGFLGLAVLVMVRGLFGQGLKAGLNPTLRKPRDDD